MNRALHACLLRVSILLAITLTAHAGPLTPPPGPITSTHKALTEVEPRIPINATNTPGDADATPSRFKINQSGSYYLTNFIAAGPGQTCIEIAGGNNVEIDMMGFSSDDGNTGAVAFISVTSDIARVTLRNGFVSNYPVLISSSGNTEIIVEDVTAFGESALGTTPFIRSAFGSCTVRRCRISSGGAAVLAPEATVEDSTFEFCGVSVDAVLARVDRCTFDFCQIGVRVGSGSIVQECTSTDSQDTSFEVKTGATDVQFLNCSAIQPVGFGIDAGTRARLVGCSVSGGIILATNHCVLDQCTVLADKGQPAFSLGENNTLTACVAQGGGSFGFLAGSGNTFNACRATGCTTAGFSVQARNIFNDCHALTNTGHGFLATDGCTFTACRAEGNSQRGFNTNDRGVFINCSASQNTNEGFFARDGAAFRACVAASNNGDGFNARFGVSAEACAARSNVGDGIEASSGAHILNGSFDANGTGAGVAANIRITGDAGRIEGNSVIAADFGIQTTSGGNVIVRNTARGNGNNYGGIAGGNDVGPIGTAATATSPWANIQ